MGGGVEMDQWLKVWAALAEDPGLRLSIHMIAHNCF